MTETQRVWFITGCCSGFGRAHAQAVIAHGNKLITTARNVETLHDLTSQALDRPWGGGGCHACVSDRQSC